MKNMEGSPASDSLNATTRRVFLERTVAGGLLLVANVKAGFTMDGSPGLDQFGIRMLYPSRKDSGSREWFAKWDDGRPRTILSSKIDPDPYDAELFVRGDGKVIIDGKGTARALGIEPTFTPRLYVHDKAQKKTWGNVEITFYAKRVTDRPDDISWRGFVAGARSEHQSADDAHPCLGRTYYGRMLFKQGRLNFQKEVVHHGAYSSSLPSEDSKADWGALGTVPPGRWIGMKYVVRNINDNGNVELALYRDMTGGKDGGMWERLARVVDYGQWSQTESELDIEKVCGCPANKILLDPGTCVFIKLDAVEEVHISKFSVREIEPDPAPYNFEDGNQNWTTTGGMLAGVSTSSEHAQAGSRSLAVSFKGAGPDKRQVSVKSPPVPAGRTVSFHLWIPPGSRISAVNPFVLDRQYAWTGNWKKASTLSTGSWFALDVNVPTSVALPLSRLGVEFTTDGPWSGTCYVDAVGW